MKLFVASILTSLALAKPYTLHKGKCAPHSLIDASHCEQIAEEMGVEFAGGTTRDGLDSSPRGCYLYNQAAEQVFAAGEEYAFYYNSGKTGECSKTRTCYCDDKPQKEPPKLYTNDLIMLDKGLCNKNAGLDSLQCRSLAGAMGLEFIGTTCTDPECAPKGCYLANGRAEKTRTHPGHFNVIRFYYNDYKEGYATQTRQLVCKRDDKHDGYGHKQDGYGEAHYSQDGYGDVHKTMANYKKQDGYGDAHKQGGYGDRDAHNSNYKQDSYDDSHNNKYKDSYGDAHKQDGYGDAHNNKYKDSYGDSHKNMADYKKQDSYGDANNNKYQDSYGDAHTSNYKQDGYGDANNNNYKDSYSDAHKQGSSGVANNDYKLDSHGNPYRNDYDTLKYDFDKSSKKNNYKPNYQISKY